MKGFASILICLVCIVQSATAQFAGWGTYDSTNSPLPSSFITSVAIDGDNVVWAATNKGLASFRELLQWDVYTTTNTNLPDNWISRVKTDPSGNIWVGTLNGVLARYNGNNSFTVFDASNSPLGAFCVTDFVFEGSTVWVSTEGGGVFRYNGSWSGYNSQSLGLPLDQALSAAIDGQNRKYFGTANDGVFRLSGNTWTRIYTLNTNLPYDNIRAITVENDTAVWFGIGQQVNDSCLTRYDGSQVTIFDSLTASGFPMRNIRHIYTDGSGNKWIASNNDEEGGLFLYNDTTFRVFREFASGLASNRVYESVMDDSSNLWVATFRGLSVFNENNLYLSEEQPASAAQFVKAWPNPATEELRFELPQNGSYTFDMLNATGSTLRSERLQAEGTVLLDIRNLQPGIYFMRFSGEEQRYLLRFVKM